MRRLSSVLLAALLTGCASSTALSPPAAVAPSTAWSDPAAADIGRQMRFDWWLELESPELNRLVEEALRANHDLAEARANLRAAQALAGQARSLSWPQGDVSAQVQRTRESALAQSPVLGYPGRFPSQTLGAVSGDLSWELDLAGGLAASARAAEADAEAALWQRRGMEAAVVAQVVRAWLDLGRSTDLLRLAERRSAALEKAVVFLERRKMYGAAREADLAAMRRLRADSFAERPALEQARNNALRRLAVLTAQDPVAFVQGEATLSGAAETPETLFAPDPVAMLRQRPDVRAAERRLEASYERAGVARAALYPSLSLGVGVGRIADPGDLLEPGALRFAVGPKVSWGLFNLGRLNAGVRAADADHEAAAAQWARAVLTALEEADGAIDAWRAARATAHASRGAAAEAEMEASAARTRAGAGAATALDLALSEAALLSAQVTSATADAAERMAWAEAHLALGAGWSPERSRVARYGPLSPPPSQAELGGLTSTPSNHRGEEMSP
ncbi:MAG: efflux transporter outer membrane subunit [Phenylobacterium sp.]